MQYIVLNIYHNAIEIFCNKKIISRIRKYKFLGNILILKIYCEKSAQKLFYHEQFDEF